jgi:hypothetical protein
MSKFAWETDKFRILLLLVHKCPLSESFCSAVKLQNGEVKSLYRLSVANNQWQLLNLITWFTSRLEANQIVRCTSSILWQQENWLSVFSQFSKIWPSRFYLVCGLDIRLPPQLLKPTLSSHHFTLSHHSRLQFILFIFQSPVCWYVATVSYKN